jgi:hypothetical protein
MKTAAMNNHSETVKELLKKEKKLREIKQIGKILFTVDILKRYKNY